MVCVMSGAVFAATEPSLDELIELILQEWSAPVVTTDPWTPASGTLAVTGTVESTGVVTTAAPTTEDINSNQEFLSALSWMYQQWLTSFSTPQTFETMGLMTRQQAAKFFVVYYETVLKKTDALYTSGCVFTDKGFDSSLLPYVQKACAYGIMKGSNGLFRPNDSILRPEFMAALIRMLEGKMRDETKEPRWIDYYMQARDYGITKEQNASAFNGKIRRYEGALYLYRSVAVSNAASQQEGNTTITTSGTIPTSETPALSTTPSLTTLISDPALQEAVYWMHDQGITKYTTVEQFRPFDSLTRQEAAKIFLAFRKATIEWAPATAGTNCQFSDLESADQTLAPYIIEACEYGLIKGSQWVFSPEVLLSKPQAVALLLRMIDGPIDESKDPWWQGYYDRAVQLGMIEATTTTNFDKPISRYEVAMLLYNSKVKTTLIKNLNNNYETNKLIYPVPNSLTTGAVTGENVGLISINTNVLNQSDIDSYVVDLFGDQYKLERIATQKYLSNDYVRYGTLLTLDETKKVGTCAFTMSNGIVVDGVIRLSEEGSKTYYVSPSSEQPYYSMRIK